MLVDRHKFVKIKIIELFSLHTRNEAEKELGGTLNGSCTSIRSEQIVDCLLQFNSKAMNTGGWNI